MNLPPLLTLPLPTPDEMRQWDEAAAQHFGIPPLLLMENAAQAALRELKRHTRLTMESKILIFMGKGNNGGDGAALARLLYDQGCTVLVYTLASEQPKKKTVAAEHAAMARNLGVNFLYGAHSGEPALPLEWRTPHIIIDAIAGTGLKGSLRPRELACVAAINRKRDASFIFSLDIPSGLCGVTGKPQPDAVRAHATVCFEAGKPGLFFPEAAEYTGHVSVRRVGIPLAVRGMIPASWALVSPEKGVWPKPSAFRHKGEAGKVLIIGGSQGMSGAPVLTALGCLRAGAGLVHLARPGGLAAASQCMPEIQDHPIGRACQWEEEHAEELTHLLDHIRPDAMVVGPGMGRSPAVHFILKALLKRKNRPPVVIDADALYCFRSEPERATESATDSLDFPIPLELLDKNDVITPHPGEMARLLPWRLTEAGAEQDERTRWIQNNRPKSLEAVTAGCKAVLVLKGPGTLIGQKGMATALCPVSVPTLAVGGSGDVLAGVCAAFIASGIAGSDAAKLAVYLHARAGQLLAKKSTLGHLAREIADTLPLAWKELCVP